MSVTEQLGGPAARGPLPGTGGPGGGLRDSAARLALLPLRLFLGFTFLYAGVDKYADGWPFSDVMSIDAMEPMMEAAKGRAAFDSLLALGLDHPELFGHGVAVAEMAIGVGVLAGFLTRLAALGGGLLSLSLWLTITWASEPFYFGHDLPYGVAFLTLALAGGGPFSVDAVIATRRARRNRRMYG